LTDFGGFGKEEVESYRQSIHFVFLGCPFSLLSSASLSLSKMCKYIIFNIFIDLKYIGNLVEAFVRLRAASPPPPLSSSPLFLPLLPFPFPFFVMIIIILECCFMINVYGMETWCNSPPSLSLRHAFVELRLSSSPPTSFPFSPSPPSFTSFPSSSSSPPPSPHLSAMSW